VLLDLEVVEVFRRQSFLEEVVEVFRRRSFLEEVVEVLGHRSFLEEVVEEEAPFPPQVVEVVVEEVLRLQDLLEEVSVQSFCAPNRLIGVGKY
jgi:predicted CoA-binding protein